MDGRINLWLLASTFLLSLQAAISLTLPFFTSARYQPSAPWHSQPLNSQQTLMAGGQSQVRGASEVAEQSFYHAKQTGAGDDLDSISLLSKEEAERNKHFLKSFER